MRSRFGMETDHQTSGAGRRHKHIRLGDLAHAAVNYFNGHIIVFNLGERLFNRLERSLSVGLNHNLQKFERTFFNALQNFLHSHSGFDELFAHHFVHLGGSRTGCFLIFHSLQNLTALHGAVQSGNLSGVRRPQLFDRFPKVIPHDFNTTESLSHNEVVPNAQISGVHKNGRHRSQIGVEMRLHHRSHRGPIGVRLQLHHFGHQKHAFQKLLDSLTLFRGNGHHHSLTAPFFRLKPVFGKLRHNFIHIGPGSIHFIDGHHNRHIGFFGMIDRFNGLRHHTVIRRHHQNGHVGCSGSTRSHGRERLVSRRIQKSNFLTFDFNLISSDVLRDSSRLAGHHIRISNGIQQSGFPMIHMTHHTHHRRTGFQIGFVILLQKFFQISFKNIFGRTGTALLFEVHSGFRSNNHRRIKINNLIQIGQNSVFHERSNQNRRAETCFFRQLFHGNHIGDFHTSFFHFRAFHSNRCLLRHFSGFLFALTFHNLFLLCFLHNFFIHLHLTLTAPSGNFIRHQFGNLILNLRIVLKSKLQKSLSHLTFRETHLRRELFKLNGQNRMVKKSPHTLG